MSGGDPGLFALGIDLLRKDVMLLLHAALPRLPSRPDDSLKRTVYNLSRFYSYSESYCRPEEARRNSGKDLKGDTDPQDLQKTPEKDVLKNSVGPQQ